MLTADELSVFPFSLCCFLNGLITLLPTAQPQSRHASKVSVGLPSGLAGRAAGLAGHLGCR